MNIINKNDLASRILETWTESNSKRMNIKITNRLKALKNPTPQEVNKAIGNTAWTDVDCHECGNPQTEVVELGEKLDYETATAHICESCLKKALNLFKISGEK